MDEPLAGAVQTDWRQRLQKVVPEYNQERARWSAVTREDIANTTKRAFDGKKVGLYREKDDLIPILLRYVEEERQNVAAMDTLQVLPPLSVQTLPMSQVTDGVEPQWEDPTIARRDRRRTITVQANPVPGVTLPTLPPAGLMETSPAPCSAIAKSSSSSCWPTGSSRWSPEASSSTHRSRERR